jgi:hypothetical protein
MSWKTTRATLLWAAMIAAMMVSSTIAFADNGWG